MAADTEALILFTKAPRPGHVKTRLQPPLSPQAAADLYRAFVLDILSAAKALSGVTLIVACHPSRSDPFFSRLADQFGVELIDQEGEDLGLRMRRALESAGRRGFFRTVLIGTDSPTLPMTFVREAFNRLNKHELVLGPSRDGGYYLIGCRDRVPPLFENMPWGSEAVLTRTLERVNELKLDCGLLPLWYDVDTPADLRWLAAHLDLLERGGEGPVPAETIRTMRWLGG